MKVIGQEEYQKQVLDLLIDIRDRLELLLSDEANHLEDFQQFAVDKCEYSYNSIFCIGCRFKRMCKFFHEKGGITCDTESE